MKDIFETYNILNGYNVSNQVIINTLLKFFVSKKIPDSFIVNNILRNKLSTNNSPDPIKITHLIGLAHQKEKENIQISQTNERSHFGIYYTDYKIALNIAESALHELTLKKDAVNLKFLEPCAGIGMFIVAYLDTIINKFKINDEKELQNIINNIYFADIDAAALKIATKLIPAYIKYRYDLDIIINKANYYTGDLLFKIEGDKITKNNPRQIFNVPAGFDIVLTNPPYKLLKANANKYDEKNERYKEEVNKIIDFIKKENVYKFNEGTLNLYKLFVEEIAENYTHEKGVLGLLIPMTILNDQQSEKLRKRIFKEFAVSTIHIIPEKNNFFPDISQAFCFFTVKKGRISKKIEVIKNVTSAEIFLNKPLTINKDDFEQISTSFPIIIEGEEGLKILNKLHKFPKLSSHSSLANLRGELDLTLHKEFITERETSLPLIKGINISEFEHARPTLYVKEEFLGKINGKKKYVAKNRLVCQQISNIHSAKRLKFTIIPKNYILGNSCNFIALEDSLFVENNLSLYYLLGILNSYLIDWRFRITNSNNHISNYELFDLPILKPNNKTKSEIEELAKILEKNYNSNIFRKLNDRVFGLYGLTENEKDYIVGNYEDPVKENVQTKIPKLELAYAV